MDIDRNTLDLDEELFEDPRGGTAPERIPDPRVEAMAPEKSAQPMLNRFEPRYRRIEPRSKGHPSALMVAAILLVALVAFAGWYLGNQPAASGHASQVMQVEKQNKAP
jgi:hypothetical protein